MLWPAGHSGNDSDRTQSHNLGRLAAFGLDLHPEKTRLIEFGRFAAPRRLVKGLGKPETFDFLGFKHIRGKHQDGKFILVRQTITKWMRDKLREIKETLYRMCHLRVPEQGRWLGQVLRGYFTYHAVPTNSRRTTAFAFHVVRHWRADAAQPEDLRPVAADEDPRRALDPIRQGPTPRAAGPLSRQTPEVGAECVTSARSDLSGGAG